MEIVTPEKFSANKKRYLQRIRKGAVFIHATDTIYGLAGNATLQKAVDCIRKAKQRDKKPFSVIAPSKEWIKKNCTLNAEAKKWLDKLPGPYTLILRLKNKKTLAKKVNQGLGTIGVRIPYHWFSNIIKQLGIPTVTTSANITGKPFMTSLKNLDSKIKSKVDFIVYEGVKKARPSTIIDLTSSKDVIKER